MVLLVDTAGLSNAALAFIVGIAFVLISLFVAIIGFFIKREIIKQDDTNNKLEKAINKLSDSITGFNGIAVRWEERQNHFEKKYEDHIRQLHKVEP